MSTYRFLREIPVTEEVDVLVVGGGMAGISAAVAAARQGAKTMLMERHAILGGIGSAGGVGAFCGETTGQGEVFDDIIRGLSDLNAIAPYVRYEEREARQFDHQVLPFVLQELAQNAGVELLVSTWFADVDYQDGAVKHVVILGKSGLEVIRPKFVIDCTGEADVVRAAGLPTAKGRESDHAQIAMSLMFFMRDTGTNVTPILPKGCEELNEDNVPMTTPWVEPVDWRLAKGHRDDSPFAKVGIKMKVIGFDATSTRQLSGAELFARKRMYSVVHYWQRTRYPTYKLDHVSTQIGIREGCRAVGEYVLSEKDVKAGRTFEDGIALGTFYLDAASPDTDKRVYESDAQGMVLFQPPPYHIPFRSLRPQGARNLLVAGRCLSADQMALSSARVMTTASMMGQAAGIAAAICADHQHDTARLDVQLLRSELIARQAKL